MSGFTPGDRVRFTAYSDPLRRYVTIIGTVEATSGPVPACAGDPLHWLDVTITDTPAGDSREVGTRVTIADKSATLLREEVPA